MTGDRRQVTGVGQPGGRLKGEAPHVPRRPSPGSKGRLRRTTDCPRDNPDPNPASCALHLGKIRGLRASTRPALLGPPSPRLRRDLGRRRPWLSNAIRSQDQIVSAMAQPGLRHSPESSRPTTEKCPPSATSGEVAGSEAVRSCVTRGLRHVAAGARRLAARERTPEPGQAAGGGRQGSGTGAGIRGMRAGQVCRSRSSRRRSARRVLRRLTAALVMARRRARRLPTMITRRRPRVIAD